jgi:hypothetical protein
MGPSFTIAAGPRQRSHSQVRVSRDSWPHFTVSDSRLSHVNSIVILQDYPLQQKSMLAGRWLAMEYSGFQVTCHNNNNNNGLDLIGPFRLINLVRPSLHFSSETSISSWLLLPNLFRYWIMFNVLHMLQPIISLIVYWAWKYFFLWSLYYFGDALYLATPARLSVSLSYNFAHNLYFTFMYECLTRHKFIWVSLMFVIDVSLPWPSWL